MSEFNFYPVGRFADSFLVGECSNAQLTVEEDWVDDERLFQLEVDELSNSSFCMA